MAVPVLGSLNKDYSSWVTAVSGNYDLGFGCRGWW